MNNSEETNQDKEEQREPRLYKVKYKGDTRQCAFLDLIMIYEYKMRLLCRRIERLFHIVFPSSDVVFYVFLLIAWLIFFVICYLLRKECITVVDLLWELKGGIFTSIIVTIIVKVSANLTKYSNSIKEQHVVYTDAMHDFTKYLCGVCDDSMWSHYMPLYNGICFNYTKEFF